ncbi:MAG: hypothetical protein QNJ97_20860 [Myxococcota bacterium]|nr:hypothetical protein [Myxococcota bacterium]
MPNPSFFDTPPLTDKTFGKPGKWFAPTGQFRNGCFQHIVWLGFSGYVIVNHFKPKQILLVDPWPSYRRYPRFRNIDSSKKRLKGLVNWLRKMREKGYAFAGMLISHEHFDHAADIPVIYELLRHPANQHRAVANMSGEKITFGSSPVPDNELPPFYGDHRSLEVIRAGNESASITAYENEILDTNGSSLDYVVTDPNPPAGTKLNDLSLGDFIVTPFIWDHMNLCRGKHNTFGLPSSAQRQSAFLIRHKTPKAKKTFIISSAGEMHRAFTIGVMPQKIDTDTLITAITTPLTPDTYRQRKALVKYQHANITVRDYIVVSHFENFVLGPTRGFKQLKRKYKRVDKYQAELALLSPEDAKKVTALKRFKFPKELKEIPDPTTMAW